MAQYPQITSVAYVSIGGEDSFIILKSQFDSEAKEQVKRKSLYPRRLITLQYNNIEDVELMTLLEFYKARYGGYQAFTFHYPSVMSDYYVKEYVAVADGSNTVYNLPFASATGITLYNNSTPFNGGDWTLGVGSGLDGMSNATFNVAPTLGTIITATFTGPLSVRARFIDTIEYSRSRNRVGYNKSTINMRTILLDEA